MPTPRNDVLEHSNETDREKILHALVVELAAKATVYEDPGESNKTIFAHCVGYRAPRPGELVVGQAGDIGWLMSIRQPEGTTSQFDTIYTVRAIGRDYVTDWNNETFRAIAGVYPPLLLEGSQRVFYNTVQSAMNDHPDGYQHKFAGVEFVGTDAVIKSRIRWEKDISRYPIQGWERYAADAAAVIEALKSQGWAES